MRLKTVEIENFRAIEKLTVPLDSQLTILHGANAPGKTGVLLAITVGPGCHLLFVPGGFARRACSPQMCV